jgi:predicted nuclease of predicted toxin-antitoxin system
VKFKLGENLGRRGREILGTAGHDVSTIADQRIETIADSELIERCQAEKRCLITLDLGFANPLTFLPSRYAGIAVAPLAGQSSPVDLSNLVRTLADAVEREEIAGKLWIVEIGRVRVYQEEF